MGAFLEPAESVPKLKGPKNAEIRTLLAPAFHTNLASEVRRGVLVLWTFGVRKAGECRNPNTGGTMSSSMFENRNLSISGSVFEAGPTFGIKTCVV